MKPESYSPEGRSQLYRFLAENGAISPVGTSEMPRSFCTSSSSYCSSTNNYYYYNMESGSVVTTDMGHSNYMTPQDKALVALRNHKEAEKRRRERINSHLDKLRTLLPCNSKTDKASLLAKVVQRVKELKHQTSQISGLETFPSESDELTVLSSEYSGNGQLIFNASLCCEDRTDLLPDLIEILNSQHLKPLRAEMITIGGRIKNVLIVSTDKNHSIESVDFFQNALKSLLESSNPSSDRIKRRRVLSHNLMAHC